MHHAELTQAIRRRVAETFAQTAGAPIEELRETILISAGAYCGRRFDAPQGHAIWFVEEDQLKFYGPDGRVAQVLDVTAGSQAASRVAA